MDATTFSSKRKPPPPPQSTTRTTSSTFVTGARGGGYFSNSYDDVFGGGLKYAASSTSLAPRAEDYSEIFGGFRTSSSSRVSSSIPVLDLPAVNGADFDAVFDYSDVFGGLHAVDFAVPFDELFRSPIHSGNSDDDDDAAWTPVGSESLSDDSDWFAFSEKSQCLNRNLHEPLEGQQFNVSYHKSNSGTSTCTQNTMHVAQLNGVPGYTCVVEEAKSLGEMGKKKVCSPLVDDNVDNMELAPGPSQKHTKKTMSHLSHNGGGLNTLDADAIPDVGRSSTMSHANSVFVSDSDINPTLKSSHLPLLSRDSRGAAAVPAERNKALGGTNSDLEVTVGGTLPPFLDMEVDASSYAAASAAAVKDVMEKAQAKLKAARESRGRKDNIKSSEKVSLKTDDSEVNAHVAHNDSLSEENRLYSKSDTGARKIKDSSKSRHVRNVSRLLPDIVLGEQPIDINGKPADTKSKTNCNVFRDATSAEVAGEWKEERQFLEFVNNDKPRLRQPFCNGDEKIATFKHLEKDNNDSDSAGEMCVPEENRRRLKATKAVSRQQYYEKMVKVAQEVHDTVTSGNAETDKAVFEVFQGDDIEQKCKFFEPDEEAIARDTHQTGTLFAEDLTKVEADLALSTEPDDEFKVQNLHQGDTIPVEEVAKAEASMASKIALENEDTKKKPNETSNRAMNGRNTNAPLQNMTGAAPKIRVRERVKESCDVVICGDEVLEAAVREDLAINAEAMRARKYKEGGEIKDMGPMIGFKNVPGDTRQTACEIQEEDMIQDVHQVKLVDKRRMGIFEDVNSKVGLQSAASEGGKNDQATESNQRCDHEADLDELEKCWEYLESLEQERSRVNVLEELVDHHSLDSHKRVGDEEKPEKIAELEISGSNSMKVVDLEDNANLCKITDLMEEPNGVCRSHRWNEEEVEVQERVSSPESELPTDFKHLKLSNGANLNGTCIEVDAVPCKLNMPKMDVVGSQEVSAEKVDGVIAPILLDEVKLKGVQTAHVQTDAGIEESTASQVIPCDVEPERTEDCILLQPLHSKADCTKVHAQRDNGNVKTVLSDSRPKPDETINGISEYQTVPPVTGNGAGDLTFHALHINEKDEKSAGVFTRPKLYLKDEDKKAPCKTDLKLVKDSKLERGGRVRNPGMGQARCDQEEKARPKQAERINGWSENASKVGAHSVMRDRKESFPITSQLPSRSQSIERKGSFNNHRCVSDVNDEENKREQEEQQRKLEEEREREREREKDRMAVEGAIREARERAFADARDRAERAALERATDEARQRAMAEARERLEKACAEARERSLADKSCEARLKAERAAVERATAEARQRAIEKARAERETFESRDRVQRSVSEQYLPERDVSIRQTSFPSTSERFENNNSEPAQRCKARLERHRRTVERVANALAEKNMRDLVAHREQAERNRFAETLDAEIKRWSSGKVGNLRALLSTLQYILGPDSGWQPVPLTEVITAAAVKKAYRKATLCVHPDKLQQRGASIQQKYICEKVFDLLKEAWNRFNSEEK